LDGENEEENLLEVRGGPRLLFPKEIETSRAEFRRIKVPIRQAPPGQNHVRSGGCALLLSK
jgi:hypothetical protein